MKDKSYEIFPGIRVTEQSDIPVTDGCERYLRSEPRFSRAPSEPDKIPEQMLRYKIARNFGWAIVGSYADKENKCYVFKCMLNADKTEDRKVSFDDVCKSMQWKSFKFCDNGLMVKFVV